MTTPAELANAAIPGFTFDPATGDYAAEVWCDGCKEPRHPDECDDVEEIVEAARIMARFLDDLDRSHSVSLPPMIRRAVDESRR